MKAINDTIKISFIAIFSFISLQTIFFNHFFGYSPVIILALILMISLAGWFILGKFNLEVVYNNRYKLLIFTIIFLFIIQSIVSYFTQQYLDHDIGRVFNGAIYYVNDRAFEDYYIYERYMNVWPNNSGLFLFFVGLIEVFNFFGFDNYYMGAIIFSQLSVSITILFSFLYLEKVFGKRASTLSLALWMIFPLTYLQGSVFYTDTFSLPIGIVILYIIELIKEETNSAKYIPLSLVLGCALFWGTEVKSTAIFIFIAYVLISILKADKAKNFICIGVSLIVMLLLSQGFNIIKYNTILDEELVEKYKMPATFWVAMGLSDEAGAGAYYFQDDDALMLIDNQEGKLEKTYDLINERLNSRTFSEHIDFYIRKINRTFGSGDGDIDYMLNRLPENPENLIYEFILEDGQYYTISNHINQSVYVLFSFLAVFSAIIMLIEKDNRVNNIFLALLGFFLFMLIWESNHRQLINQIPYYIILSAIAISSVLKNISSRKNIYKIIRR